MDRLFLDSNILFSAAYRTTSIILRFWELDDATLITSVYAVGEARRNLDTTAQRARLDDLIKSVEVVLSATHNGFHYYQSLPEKDRPILLAAVRAGATHLITGDIRHFGKYFGQTVDGVLVMKPTTYMENR